MLDKRKICNIDSIDFVYYTRYLATGDQILSIALAYRIGESTARAVIKETCAFLIEVLSPILSPSS